MRRPAAQLLLRQLLVVAAWLTCQAVTLPRQDASARAFSARTRPGAWPQSTSWHSKSFQRFQRSLALFPGPGEQLDLLKDFCKQTNDQFLQANFSCSGQLTSTAGQSQVFYTFRIGADDSLNTDITVQPNSPDALDWSIVVKPPDNSGFEPLAPDIVSQDYGGGNTLSLTSNQYVANSTYAILINFTSTAHSVSYTISVNRFQDPPSLLPAEQTIIEEIASNCCAAGCMGGFGGLNGNYSALCTLPQVHCNYSSQAVTYLDLSSSGLVCDVTQLAGLGRLTSLISLNLASNNISGDFTVFLTVVKQLPSLIAINLDLNPNLSGTLPSSCSAYPVLSMLQELYLASTSLVGSIAECIFSPSLYIMDVSDNMMTGDLPALPSTSVLRVFGAARNSEVYPRFTGSDLDWSESAELKVLNLQGCQLTGTLKLNPAIYNVFVDGNQLQAVKFVGPSLASGALPPMSLVQFTADGNLLSGTIPLEIASAPALTYLSAAFNSFTDLPESWSTPSLAVLVLSGNQLTGSVPPYLVQQSKLMLLDLSYNQLNGTLDAFGAAISANPAAAGNLVILDLHNNSISGTLDNANLSSLGVFTSTQTVGFLPQTLLLSNNSLTGAVPAAVVQGIANQLQRNVAIQVDLQGNQLTCGTGPTGLLSSDYLSHLGCSPDGHGSDRISAGAAAGIAIVVIASVLLLVGIVVLVVVKRRQRGARRGTSFNPFLGGRFQNPADLRVTEAELV